MSDTRTLRIGIMSRDEMRERTLAIARGALKPSADDPKVWFTSVESLAQVLSTKNRLLLEIIRKMRPASMKELAQLSGRHESNLSRSLRTMERYGLVRLNRQDHRIIPEVPYDELDFRIPLSKTSPELARA